MKFVDKLERKFGRFAVRNLMLYIIILYAAGFLIQRWNPLFYWQYLSLDASAILRGQIWRIVTFLMYPPSDSILWIVLLSYIYFCLGRTLEQVMGTFRFNLYIYLGVFGYVIAAISIYAFSGQLFFLTAGNLYLSMLLAIAAAYPDAEFLLYFVFPIKAKWLGLFYGAMEIYTFIQSDWVVRVAIAMSLLNFLVFFVFLRRPVQRAKQTTKKVIYKAKVNQVKSGPRHRCAICGRTELEDPLLEFRYCSKCEGNYEYCQDHLYTHMHVTKGSDGGEKN